MNIIVQKYGGSSVATTEKIKNIAKKVVGKASQGNVMVIVLSAMGKTTNHLIQLSEEVSSKPDKRELDQLLSTGEIVSISLLAMAIKELGYDAVSYTGYQISIETTDTHGEGSIKDINSKKIMEELKQGKIVIIAGFQGMNSVGDMTTLGRGGSDTTAVALACKLHAKCEIYTDVDGIYSTDPRKYDLARKLDYISYEEMMELSCLGAKVMHARSVELASKYNIPIYVGLSTENQGGTYIMNNEDMELKTVTGMATNNDDIVIHIKDIEGNINIISKLFNIIAENNISIDMISQTAPVNKMVSVSFTIPMIKKSQCMDLLTKYVQENQINVEENITKFSVVGLGMRNATGVAAKVFRLFDENHIEVKMITTSEIRITCAINRSDEEKAVSIIAQEFNL
ncbi:aspartate kinase [Hathewaya proteolytica]|nr:aspartate kinase [Hathewaya proteolytica]